jgi:regulator of sirC expression with transglutaminase-like and TPR domain
LGEFGTTPDGDEGLEEKDRLDKLIHFFFEEKSFHLHDSQDVSEIHLSLSRALTDYSAHPYVATLLFLHLAHSLQIPLFWIQSTNKSILKWHRSGRCEYIDFLRKGKTLTEEEVLKVFEAKDCRAECWSPAQLYKGYLDLITQALEKTTQPKALLLAYSLAIQLDDSNTHLLARRAFLRYRLGYTKDAHADLKRYFSFVEKKKAPFEIIDLYQKVLDGVEQSVDIPQGPGPIYH